MFTKNGEPHRFVIGLDGGVYVCRWRAKWSCWQIVGSDDR
jgi:hypothetical protein